MATQISVTLDDIQHGERKSCTNCPVARAIGPFLPPGVEIQVGPIYLDFYWKNGSTRIQTPSIAEKFIVDFDQGYAVKPISFMLDLDPVFAAMEVGAA
jgi:hypothetical protein